jgi:Predicted secreted acid phosphatase
MKKLMTAILFFSSITNASEKEHELLMATLYVQSSAEFYANSKTIYQAAKNDLQNLLKDTNHTAALEQNGNYSKKPPAIILDVDQTVLDNSAYHARIIEKDTSYPECWFSWAKEKKPHSCQAS